MKNNQIRKNALMLAALVPLASLCAHADPALKSSKTAPILSKRGGVADAGRVIAKPTVDPKIGTVAGNGGIVTKQLASTGEQYRLWMSFIPTPCNDALVRGRASTNDHKFECYGELKVNDKTEWKAGRPYAGSFLVREPATIPTLDKIDVKREGYSLNLGTAGTSRSWHEISVTTDKTKAGGQIAHLALQLFDVDPRPAGLPPSTPTTPFDDKFGDFNVDLDLAKLGASDGRYYWFWRDTDAEGNAVGSNLYLFVEHVKSVYTRHIPNVPPPHPRAATGRRVRVESRLYVTNSADGFMDNVVELGGKLTFDDIINLDVPRVSAGAGADVKLKSATVVVKYGDARFSHLRVSGEVYDIDKISNKDMMWKNYYPVDLLDLMRSGSELQVRGDRDSESADLYIRVFDEGEVFD